MRRSNQNISWADAVELQDTDLCNRELGNLADDSRVYWQGRFTDLNGEKKKLLFRMTEPHRGYWFDFKIPGYLGVGQAPSHMTRPHPMKPFDSHLAYTPLGVTRLADGVSFRRRPSDAVPPENLADLATNLGPDQQWVDISVALPKKVLFAAGKVSPSTVEFEFSTQEGLKSPVFSFCGTVTGRTVSGRWTGPSSASGDFQVSEISRAEYRKLKSKKKQKQQLTMGPASGSELVSEDGRPVTLEGIKSVYFLDLETALLDKATQELLTGPTQLNCYVFAFQRLVAKGPLKCSGCGRVVDVPWKSVAGKRLFIRRTPKARVSGYRALVPFDGDYFEKNVWPLLTPQTHFYYVSNSRESAGVFRAIHAVFPKSTHVNPAAGTPVETSPTELQVPNVSVSALQELAFPLAMQNAAAILKRQPNQPNSDKKSARIIEPGCAVQVSCCDPGMLLDSLMTSGVLKTCECGGLELLRHRLPASSAQSETINLAQKLSSLAAQGQLPTTLAGWQNTLAQLVKVRVKVPALQVLASLNSGVLPDPSGPAEALPASWTSWGIKKLNLLERRLVTAFEHHHSGLFVAPVGSGRTLGLVLATVKLALTGKKVLIVTATREAAQQMALWLEGLKLGDLDVRLEIGGTPVTRKRLAGTVIVGTAGRLVDLQRRNMIDLNASLAAFDDVTCQLDQLNALLPLLPANVARVVVSAEGLETSETLRTLFGELPVTKFGALEWPTRVIAGRVDVDREEFKLETLRDLLRLIPGQAIVFCNTRRKIDWLMDEMGALSCDAHHADLDPKMRDAALKRWTSGDTRVLLASEVLSVGIDNPNCELVRPQLTSGGVLRLSPFSAEPGPAPGPLWALWPTWPGGGVDD